MGAISLYGITQLADYNRSRRLESEYRQLTEEYLDPAFSPDFCRYWRIDNYRDYKKALKQQFDIARFEAMEQAYGESEGELIRFARARMINWLQEQLIDRAEWLLQFERRTTDIGPYSIDIKPLSDDEFRALVPF